MSEAAADTPLETLKTEFLTWHLSAGSLHVRTPGRILYIDKSKPELIERVQRLARHQPITVKGRTEFSTTLSNYVFAVETLEE